MKTATVFFILSLLLAVCARVQAQDVIRCTNGTEVIFIHTPGFCPTGFWAV